MVDGRGTIQAVKRDGGWLVLGKYVASYALVRVAKVSDCVHQLHSVGSVEMVGATGAIGTEETNCMSRVSAALDGGGVSWAVVPYGSLIIKGC